MIYILSTDEDGKKLGVAVSGSGRIGGRRGDMERNELAGGKACFGRDDDIDPNSFSYIDEKIQHVLGHFQKDFEGGLSAESLGAKYGGYGSFLPSYQRSPSTFSQTKSPAKMLNHSVSRSPYRLQPQDGHQNPSVLGATPINKVSPASVGQFTEMPGKRKTSISTHRPEAISHSLSKPVNISDQKMLKVRIKIGHDNGLPQNKPDIYSDLGLDVSPSPSQEDAPNGNEECSEHSDAFLKSPATILQIMTSSSVPGGCILSPLPDSLQHSNGKEVISPANFRTGAFYKGQTDACVASSDTSLNLKFVNDSAFKNIKSRDKSEMLNEACRLTFKGDMITSLEKETAAETPIAQKVIYNDHDMPHSSRARCGDAREERQINGSSAKEGCNKADNFKDPVDISLKERIHISNLISQSPAGFVESMRKDFTGDSVKEDVHSNGEVYSKSDLTIKSFEERNGNNQDTSCASAEGESKTLKNYNTTKADYRRYNSGLKSHTIELEGSANHNPVQKAASFEKDPSMTTQELQQAHEGGRVPKRSPTNERPCTESSKENLRNSTAHKGKNEMSHLSKLKAHKLHKKVKKGKAIESYKGLGISTSIQKVENKHNFGSSRFVEKSKDKQGFHKVDNLQIANSAPLAYNAPTSDAPATVSASVIKDNWVLCDLCKAWRLLPYETNPDDLPKRWQCSMQVWLSGLNKCYISEDETTKAFHQLYQVHAPVTGTDLAVHPDAAVPGITSDDILDQNGRLENNACSIPSGAKQKHGLTAASSIPIGSPLSYFSSSVKNLRASSENRSLNDATRYSLEMDSSIKHRAGQTSKSADLTIEKHKRKVEEKPHKISASCLTEGDLFGKGGENSRSKSSRKFDLDDRRSFKKIKKDDIHYSEKDLLTSDETVGNITINGDCHLPPRASKKVFQSSGDHFSAKDFKSKAAPKNLEPAGAFSNGEHKEHVSASDALKLGNYDSNDKKRGLKELKESGTHHKKAVVNQQLLENRSMIKGGSSQSEVRMHKKAKVAKSEGKDSSAVVVNGKKDKKGCLTGFKLSSSKKYQPGKIDAGSIHAFECMDAMKRDGTNVQPVTAATSSSSKASVSQKSKVNLHAARESPVESVSSSPMRILNTRNNSTKLNLSTKDDISSIGPSLKGSPKRIYNGDVDASDQSRTRTKDQASKSNLIISKNCNKRRLKILDSYSDHKELDHLPSNRENNLENSSMKYKVHDLRVTATGESYSKLISQEYLHQASSKQKLDHSSHIIVDRSEGSSGKMIQTSHNAKAKQEKDGWGSQTVPPSMKERNSEQYHVNEKAPKSAKKIKMFDGLNDVHSNIFHQPSPTVPECSPTKKDEHITVNDLIQEARDLKHTANRLKNNGLERESSGIFFEASLKFLHVAYLMEPPITEFVRQGDMSPSVKMLKLYMDTAIFCEFCAREYENLKEMAAAALAYKCAEVAYMKYSYFKHSSANKDRHELQAALNSAQPGEPSSPPVSDVDILNNQGGLKKDALARDTGSPQLADNCDIASRSWLHVKRLLTYTSHLNSAFEAANKSRNAMAAASIGLDKDRNGSLCSVRKVLDFNFNNVEGLLKLVRRSLNSISHQV